MNIHQIQELFKANGYDFFTEGRYNLNLFGVRSINAGTNKFDDKLYIVYKDDRDKWTIHTSAITTDPGAHWLQKPMNPAGTAILKAGQYRSTYKIAKHQGKYYALCQRKPVTVYRDNDRDSELDMNPEETQSGLFGINIHRSNPYGKSYQIDRWSAGCQVFANAEDFNLLMTLAGKAAKVYGNSFTYTLFDATSKGQNILRK
jgi:hypothetical protein